MNIIILHNLCYAFYCICCGQKEHSNVFDIITYLYIFMQLSCVIMRDNMLFFVVIFTFFVCLRFKLKILILNLVSD